MKGFVPLSFVLSITYIGLAVGEEQLKSDHPKHSYNTANSIGSTAKPDLFFGKYQPEPALFQQRYQARPQQLQQAVPYNHQPDGGPFQQLRKPFGMGQQQTPIAMVIIAQPAYIPASMLQQGNVAQQLLQYFQGGNSQLKYQYVPANHQPFYQSEQPPQQFGHYQQPQAEEPDYSPVAQAQTSQFYPHEALPSPQALVSQQPHQLSQSQNNQLSQVHPQAIDFQPQRLQQLDEPPQQDGAGPDFSQLAQQAAQHFISSGGLNSGGRTAPAIITGLEHFSPEQQEKIKKQLSAHFGSPLKPLSLEGQEAVNRQQEQEKRQRAQTFVPSIQVKDGEITQSKM
ncbi:glutenin, high molecular weight subunit DX5 [Dendroctonus ponderosae]